MPKNSASSQHRSKTRTPNRVVRKKHAVKAATSQSGTETKRTNRRTLREELEKASSGLTHTSESDRPYGFFTLPAAQYEEFLTEEELTLEVFLIRLGISQQSIDALALPVNKLIEEVPLEEFLPNIDDLAGWAGTGTDDPDVVAQDKRWRKLEALLRKRLRGVKVFRVGEVEIRCYIAGYCGKGEIAGLATVSIET